MFKKGIKWLIVIALYSTMMSLFGEYIVSRETPYFLQLLSTIVVIIATAWVTKRATESIVNLFKKKEEND